MSVIFPFPVMHERSLDYIDPRAYGLELRRDDKRSLTALHSLSSDTLVGELVGDGLASFYCTLSVRGTAYCRTQLSDRESVMVSEHTVRATQRVEVPAFSWQPEVFANCGVVLHESKTVAREDASGVDKFFFADGAEEIAFPKHARIATSGWKRFFSMNSLFQIKSDREMDLGPFKAVVGRSDPIQITITMHPSLYDEVKFSSDSRVRAHVLCSALTQAFEELRQASENIREAQLLPEDEDEQFLEHAEGLENYLKSRNIQTWREDGFIPSYAASKCYEAIEAMSEDSEEY